jgi:hypothetical protein
MTRLPADTSGYQIPRSPAVADLTDSTTGTAGDTVDDATASVKDDIASLAAKINAILAALRAARILVP